MTIYCRLPKNWQYNRLDAPQPRGRATPNNDVGVPTTAHAQLMVNNHHTLHTTTQHRVISPKQIYSSSSCPNRVDVHSRCAPEQIALHKTVRTKQTDLNKRTILNQHTVLSKHKHPASVLCIQVHVYKQKNKCAHLPLAADTHTHSVCIHHTMGSAKLPSPAMCTRNAHTHSVYTLYSVQCTIAALKSVRMY